MRVTVFWNRKTLTEPEAAAPPRVQAPTTPADTLYQTARQALNRGDYERAAELFAQLRADEPGSEYVADAYYYEAFARFRAGSRENLDRALDLLWPVYRDLPNSEVRQAVQDELLPRSLAGTLKVREPA